MKLRTIRIVLATLMFLCVMSLFLDFTGTVHPFLGWAARVQFLPSVLALNLGVVVILVLLTLLFGRLYCSVICPLGVFQDLLSRLRPKRNRFTYKAAHTWLRWTMVGVLVLALVLGVGAVVTMLAPYSSFGRIAQNIFQPAYVGINNLLALWSEQQGNYDFAHHDLWVRSWPTFVTAIVTLLTLLVLTWLGGRTYCNTICPVGTVLGVLSRFALFRVVLDADRCKGCRKCERNCKSECIDVKNRTIDHSRCVACGNCLEQCAFGALHYGRQTAKASVAPAQTASAESAQPASDKSADANNGRREFLVGAGMALTAAALAQDKKKVDGGLAFVTEHEAPVRQTPLTPPGSRSARNMQTRCTGCQLCVSQCPNDVLRPSTDLMRLMQPTMSYEHGYCRPECNRCSSVCPAGAIQPLTLAEKSSVQIGHAVWVAENCLPTTTGASCGNCARHCPSGAIQMVYPNGDTTKAKIPAINEARCIGCGACENLCPARPFAAIYVEGHEVHKLI